MTAARPTVSIILPTYNRMAFLPEAVESVVAQTYPAWELIVIDDGSTDGTAGFLAGRQDPRISVLRLPHSGRPGNLRNRGIAVARGAYLAFLDSDDVWVPEKLERQMADLQARGRRWGYAHHQWIDERGGPLAAPPGRHWKSCDGWILRDVLVVDAWVSMPTVVVERSLMEEVGGFDETFPVVSDYEAWVRLAEAAPAALIAEPLAAVRVHPHSLSRERVEDMHVHLARLYRTLAEEPRFADHRSLCRGRFAVVSLALATIYRAAGRYREALWTLGAALRARPLRAGAWAEVAKTLLHPLVPARVLAMYHRMRTPSPRSSGRA